MAGTPTASTCHQCRRRWEAGRENSRQREEFLGPESGELAPSSNPLCATSGKSFNIIRPPSSVKIRSIESKREMH